MMVMVMVRPFFFTSAFNGELLEQVDVAKWVKMSCKMSKPQYWNDYDQIIKRSLFYNIFSVDRIRRENALSELFKRISFFLVQCVHLAKASNARVQNFVQQTISFSLTFSIFHLRFPSFSYFSGFSLFETIFCKFWTIRITIYLASI